MSGFVTAIDRDGNGHISPREILRPPKGVYGVAAGIELGVGVPIDPLPASIDLTVGLRKPNKDDIRRAYDKMRRHGVEARLVDDRNRTCDAEWPASSRHEDCVVAIGAPHASNALRAREVGKAMCALVDCTLPLGRTLRHVSIQQGVLHDLSRSRTPLSRLTRWLCD